MRSTTARIAQRPQFVDVLVRRAASLTTTPPTCAPDPDRARRGLPLRRRARPAPRGRRDERAPAAIHRLLAPLPGRCGTVSRVLLVPGRDAPVTSGSSIADAAPAPARLQHEFERSARLELEGIPQALGATGVRARRRAGVRRPRGASAAPGDAARQPRVGTTAGADDPVCELLGRPARGPRHPADQ